MNRNRLALYAFAAASFALAGSAGAQTPSSVDMGSQVPDAASVKEGLFPEDACKEVEKSGLKCMGLKPAVRYSLPASSFKVGSADLPELLKKQLDVFADVMRGRKGAGGEIRVVGHADASGTPEGNRLLSVKRAEAVKAYLVKKGAEPTMLVITGKGAEEPVNAGNPNAPENRRVEIGRAPPK